MGFSLISHYVVLVLSVGHQRQNCSETMSLKNAFIFIILVQVLSKILSFQGNFYSCYRELVRVCDSVLPCFCVSMFPCFCVFA